MFMRERDGRAYPAQSRHKGLIVSAVDCLTGVRPGLRWGGTPLAGLEEMRIMMDFGASGRPAGVSLLALAFALASSAPAVAKDVPGRTRCFVAGVETYKEEPVYRDKSSGYQRVQVPGSKGERCFWEPLDYQAAAAAAPVRPSRAAPAISGRHARETSAPAASAPRNLSAKRTAEARPAGSPGPVPTQADPAPAPEAAPQQPAAPQRLAALPPQPRPQRPPDPVPARPEPEPQAAPPQPAPEPAKHEPVAPVLEPRGLTSGGASGGLDLRIQTRPVVSGGTVSTVSSGPEIRDLAGQDQAVPPLAEPMSLGATRTALASLSPRTAVRSSEPPASEPPAPKPAARESRPAASSAAAAPARPASSGKGGYFVQLGSVTSYQKAKQFWTDVTGRYPDPLAGFSPNIVEADIPDKGIYYRVRVGPLNKGDAKRLCKRLDGNCLVVSQ